MLGSLSLKKIPSISRNKTGTETGHDFYPWIQLHWLAEPEQCKKMYISEKDFLTTKVMVEFTIPKLHKGKKWYVDYFAYDLSIENQYLEKDMFSK